MIYIFFSSWANTFQHPILVWRFRAGYRSHIAKRWAQARFRHVNHVQLIKVRWENRLSHVKQTFFQTFSRVSFEFFWSVEHIYIYIYISSLNSRISKPHWKRTQLAGIHRRNCISSSVVVHVCYSEIFWKMSKSLLVVINVLLLAIFESFIFNFWFSG